MTSSAHDTSAVPTPVSEFVGPPPETAATGATSEMTLQLPPAVPAPRTQGRRSQQRRRARRRVYLQALTTSTALLVHAGPLSTVAASEWQRLVDRAMLATTSAPLHACLQSGRPFSSWITSIPRWARELHRASELSRDAKTFEMVLARVLEPVDRFCRVTNHGEGGRPPEDDPEVYLDSTGYSVSRSQQNERFRQVDPQLLDLPDVGAKLLDPLDYAGFPFNIIFSEVGLRQCMVDEPPHVRGHTSLNLAPGVDKKTLFDVLKHMIYVSTDPADMAAACNGFFALLKKLDKAGIEHHRLVFDGVHGNAYFCMKKVQHLYERLCAAHPELAARLRCGSKVMNIASPSDIADFPPGAACKSSSDYSSYFFQWAQLKFLQRYQGICNVPGHVVGRPEKLVRVGMKVLGMGNFMAALIAHVGHWVLLTRALVDHPLRAVLPEHTSSAHRADLAAVVEVASNEDDGCVPWPAIPLRMRCALRAMVPACAGGGTGGSDLLASLRVPPAMLAFEPLPRSETGSVGRNDWVEVTTSLVGGDNTARGDVAATLALNRSASVARHYHALAVVYQDDNDTFMYPPAPASSVSEQRLASSLGGFHRLVTMLAADQAGLKQNFDKLRFPTRDTTPTLGVEVEFLPGKLGLCRHAVSPERRRATVAELQGVVSLALRRNVVLICEKQLASLVGDTTWAFLVRRVLLSALDLCYKAAHSPNRPPGQVRLVRALVRELWVMAGLLPLAESTSSYFTDVLTTFDASGKSKLGNGGYGVAYKSGLTQETAVELTSVVRRDFGRLPVFKVQPTGAAPLDRLAQPRHKAPATRAARFLQCSWTTGSATDWKAARSGRFKTAPRIVTVAESYAGNMAFESAMRHTDAGHRLMCIGGDNMAADLSLVKGRSSKVDLNRVCSRVAARSLLYDVEARWWWMPSKANPSDGPSRWWCDSRPRRTAVLSAPWDPALAVPVSIWNGYSDYSLYGPPLRAL